MHWSSSPTLRAGFDLVERDRRWKRIRELMTAQGADLLIVASQWMMEDALYLANQAGAVIFPLDGEPSLIIGGEGSNRALAHEGWVKDRSSATERGSTRVAYGEAVARKIKERGLRSKRVAIAGLKGHQLVLVRQPEGTVSYTTVQNILEALPGAELQDGTPILAGARHRKSEVELEVMREAVRIGERGAEVLIEKARAGVAQADVFAEIVAAMMREGAHTSDLSWCGGRWGEPKWRYTSPPPGLIEDHWKIDTEIGPTVRGYNCQVEEPLAIGKLNDEMKDIWELGKAAFVTICREMKPGNTWGEVTREVKKLATPKYMVEFLIHGRGLGNEGPMLIPVDTHKPFAERLIEENSTFILKPYAHPDVPNYPHVTRSHSMTWGDTVVVRPGGAERLGRRPHELHVIA